MKVERNTVSKTCYLQLLSCFTSVTVVEVCIFRQANDKCCFYSVCMYFSWFQAARCFVQAGHKGWSAMVGRKARPISSGSACEKSCSSFCWRQGNTNPLLQGGSKDSFPYVTLPKAMQPTHSPHPRCFSMESMTLLLGWLLSG